MTEIPQRRAHEAGFSLVELSVVVALMGILVGMVLVQMGVSRPAAIGDGAMRAVLSQMNAARELAITQRRNMRLTFGSVGGNTNNVVQVVREEVPGPTLTTVSSTLFEGGMQFLTVSGLPDTPDAFGATSAVTFPTATGTPIEIKFAPDGTFVNQDGLTLNGTVFVALPSQAPSQALSARAMTIFGSTGRIRGYRWDGRNWKPV
jgi:prepilin-type N-terminal cleavage/methylation domain-containing protein